MLPVLVQDTAKSWNNTLGVSTAPCAMKKEGKANMDLKKDKRQEEKTKLGRVCDTDLPKNSGGNKAKIQVKTPPLPSPIDQKNALPMRGSDHRNDPAWGFSGHGGGGGTGASHLSHECRPIELHGGKGKSRPEDPSSPAIEPAFVLIPPWPGHACQPWGPGAPGGGVLLSLTATRRMRDQPMGAVIWAAPRDAWGAALCLASGHTPGRQNLTPPPGSWGALECLARQASTTSPQTPLKGL